LIAIEQKKAPSHSSVVNIISWHKPVSQGGNSVGNTVGTDIIHKIIQARHLNASIRNKRPAWCMWLAGLSSMVN
jgi:hypothetical protein